MTTRMSRGGSCAEADQPRARYWARAPTESLFSRFDRCRPSSTYSTADATAAGDGASPTSSATGTCSDGTCWTTAT